MCQNDDLFLQTFMKGVVGTAFCCFHPDIQYAMAKRRVTDLSRTFKRDTFLQEFYLEGVLPTGENLGMGSYGCVVEVTTRIVEWLYIHAI